ncbi:MAG: TIGR04282 family arsenosugar biosynthesis glycosyltransferase [Acidobacteria bacterium]|nr:TIGR04282 family arsenosugar biosynthesis glycosyltransferase [Acidobacteriota bacterium]
MKAMQKSSASIPYEPGLPVAVPVCIFVKPFVAGQVKTRLIPSLGAEGAAELAEAMFQDTQVMVRAVPWAQDIIASTAPMPKTLASNNRVWLQGEGNLGARLERILRQALAYSEMAIAIGADSPGLPLRVFEQARSRLQSADAVFGPCEDGGFYLLGLRRCPSGFLDTIAWSQHDTLLQAMARFRKFGLTSSLLDRWFDVDRPDGLERLCSFISSGQIAAPRTAEMLRRLKTPRGQEVRGR